MSETKFAYHDGRREPRMVRKVPKGPASYSRPHVPEATMAEMIVAYWLKRGYANVLAEVGEDGIVRSNLGPNARPPKE